MSHLEKPTPQKIRALGKEIVPQFQTEQIVLFGSYAYGRPSPDSDVDLLVTMDTKLRPVEQAVRIRQVVDCSFPIDLLVRAPKQIKNRFRLGDFFLREIRERGKVLYEAPL